MTQRRTVTPQRAVSLLTESTADFRAQPERRPHIPARFWDKSHHKLVVLGSPVVGCILKKEQSGGLDSTVPKLFLQRSFGKNVGVRPWHVKCVVTGGRCHAVMNRKRAGEPLSSSIIQDRPRPGLQEWSKLGPLVTTSSSFLFSVYEMCRV